MVAGRTEKVAKRYARALFEVCEPKDFDVVSAQLATLSSLWNDSADFRQSMLNPSVSDALRLQVIESLVAALGGWKHEPTRRTVHQLVSLRKAATLPSLARIYAGLVSEYRKSLSLEVTLAQPANDDVVANLKGRLSQALGGDVALTVTSDPALIGGLTIRLGDKLLDRSVAGTLQRMASQISR
jgi:F-type H+-transporting ATPase subunit delta